MNSEAGKIVKDVPPLPMRQVIEKTVAYVRKNGASFEDKLRQNDANGQFAFLSPEHQYNSYYIESLKASTEGKPAQNGILLSTDKSKPENTKQPDELLFLTTLPPISNHDLEVIKATAIYVACNLPKNQDAFHKFMERKGRRNQFAFMNKSHTLHGLFQTYVHQYRAIIDKQQGSSDSKLTKLIDSYLATDKMNFFRKAYERAAFEKRHKIREKNKEQDIKARQVHYASIDWQDFSFVSKVNFDAIDEVSELPVPMLRESIIYRSLETKAKDLEFTVSPAVQTPPGSEMFKKTEKTETQSKDEGNQPPPPATVPKGMKIKAAGESRLKRKAMEQEATRSDDILCPITGTLVPQNEFDLHLKTLLRDPRYKEQQDNFMRKNFTYESNLTTDQVYDNIKRLVGKRKQSEEEEQAVDSKRINMGV
ncbi:pre-mRNA splicing factor [Metschnikowia bicuspidata var. bicuspidata NRRL YB-4993]|uniref:Pre-mRNA splicing factor n=1 Tax=Metschnikowia bicuspidata var. bicuspidata NRRL YB-4993 TaxID=869754 RepID=A0A1A0HIV8_9ASCO|nr:pre-mRNA splicing factor [Metschnikowia bicuspidata var. bicuspidata NRRL YB-4993]OBA23773.1 pre-mRNA splicing factor [Metschnikowia bicuspidata var. bicuspidata NRRL YB-4993]